MNKAIFKAYDIRGRYPEEINEKVVGQITHHLGRYFKKGKIVVGCDARISSPKIYQAVLNTLQYVKGLALIEAGMITTPMLYFLVGKLKARGGIMITASHSPKEFNGLKVVKFGAEPMSGTEIRELVTRD